MEVYRFLHFSGLIAIFTSLGALGCWYAVGRSKTDDGFRALAMTHGFGMILALVGGFGMAARLGISSSPWVILKTAMWFVLGGAMVMMRRINSLKSLGAVIALGTITVYFAVFKPL
ncbi:MAG: hypothetical protein AB8C84_07070 [Oligoflexales bacterium]